jgi:hypothetical protein
MTTQDLTSKSNLKIPGITRRRFLGTMGALAVPALAFGDDKSSRVELFAVGDWGAPPDIKPKDVITLHRLQDEVAKAMADYARDLAAKGQPLTAVLALGDNFYGRLDGPTDARFQQSFENLYPVADLNVPFYFVLGNHEYEDFHGLNGQHEIAYARNNPASRWKWPAVGNQTWYQQDFPGNDPLVTAVMLNTNTEVKPADWDAQIGFMQHGLENARIQKKSITPISFTTYPVFST